ncbi:unnamed protein product [Clonostachys rosea]|uniref:Srp40 C-terminal domain-containing protein n=1 Tax=Bionectria ochroleuca TaxID=29856 RepID=A0ABY6U1L8_BIOOC|nr:unnamed protein product [Clonostachys rosea]
MDARLPGKQKVSKSRGKITSKGIKQKTAANGSRKSPAKSKGKNLSKGGKTANGKSPAKNHSNASKAKTQNGKSSKSNSSKEMKFNKEAPGMGKTHKGNSPKGKAHNGRTPKEKAALAKGNKSTKSPKGGQASCSAKRGLGSVGAACKAKFDKDPNVRKDAGTQKLEELADKKGIKLKPDTTYSIKEKTGGILSHEYVAGVKYQKNNNQGVEEHPATGQRYDLFVGGKKMDMKDKIQKNDAQVDKTLNAKGSTRSKLPTMHSKDAAYIEGHNWKTNKKKGGSELL